MNLSFMEPGYLINEESIEVIPKNVVDGVMNENVDISLIRKYMYFTPDAWMQKRMSLHGIQESSISHVAVVRKLLVRVAIG